MSRYKRLLLTFDAFGTLFTPRETIGKQYAEVARKHGLSGFTNDQIESSFRAAFKSEAGRFPNYGKTVGMSPSQWWSNVRCFSITRDAYYMFQLDLGCQPFKSISTTFRSSS